VFTSTRGYQRWHCHACSAGGTAIDLLLETTNLTVREALQHLADRADLDPTRHPPDVALERPNRPVPVPMPQPAAFARQALREHVARCHELLWTDTGRPMLDYLHARGLHDEILRTNHVGADPGPRHLTRARGLPARGPAVIFPVLDDHGPIYLQARYLNPEAAGGRKYENPARWVATNPRWAAVRKPDIIDAHSRLWICEGIPDALSVAEYPGTAIAVLGVGLADQDLAIKIQLEHPRHDILIAFDSDERGRAAAHVLKARLEQAGQPHVTELALPNGINDLNDWAVRQARKTEHTIERVIPSLYRALHR
jgi:DNA primase